MEKPRRVVYTALIGEGESLQEFDFQPAGDIEYICFTNQQSAKSSSWKIVRVEARFAEDPTRSSRVFKMLGHEELAGFDQWLWIDNKIRLLSEPREIFEFLPPGVELAMALHDHRFSVREEFKAVNKLRKDHSFRVGELKKFLETNYPLILDQHPIAGTIILRKNTPQVANLMEVWFETVLRYSRRDQLAINYALDRVPVSFTPLPFSVSGSAVHEHVSGEGVGRTKRLEKFPYAPSYLELSKALLQSYLSGDSIKRLVRASLARRATRGHGDPQNFR